MPTQDDIANQRQLLAAHRATLAILLRQVATHTVAYAPPAQLIGIAEARAGIARCKKTLHLCYNPIIAETHNRTIAVSQVRRTAQEELWRISSLWRCRRAASARPRPR